MFPIQFIKAGVKDVIFAQKLGQRAAAVAAERAAVPEWYEKHKEQLPDGPPPPAVARSGYNGNGVTPE